MYKLFITCFDHEYFRDWNIVMNTFDINYLSDLNVPKNFIIVKESPQITILKRCDLYVCHGGRR